MDIFLVGEYFVWFYVNFGSSMFLDLDKEEFRGDRGDERMKSFSSTFIFWGFTGYL